MKGDIKVQDLPKVKTEDLRQFVFSMIPTHEDYITMDREYFLYLLGYYPAVYAYLSELFTFMIGEVRSQMELGDRFKTSVARDKRDILEQGLKSIKLLYESVSRKITVLVPSGGDI